MLHHVTPKRLSCKVFREIHETGCGGLQRVETGFPVAVNHRVAGSSPARGANKSKELGQTDLAPCFYRKHIGSRHPVYLIGSGVLYCIRSAQKRAYLLPITNASTLPAVYQWVSSSSLMVDKHRRLECAVLRRSW